MKTLKVLLVFIFTLTLIGTTQAQSKVKKFMNENFEFVLTAKIGGEYVDYSLSGVEDIKITPSGNLLRIVTIKVPKDDPIMELAYPFIFLSVTATGDFNRDGEEETIKDSFAVLTWSGNLKLVYHMNGN